MDGEATNKRLSLRRLTPLAVIAAAVSLFFALGLDQYLSFEALKENRHALLDWRDRNPIAAVLVYIIGYIVAVALSL
ncbi:MAG: TVP38/TMEM64 family protein, partial [Rhodoplanes sp.]